ncbi:L-histidine N(alpha)-methyltransferase [Christiangramia aquimixticola]|uniref:L-histidine N(alpha)-methyltransferase n=1 Tax=Christiangramia aquimixticola TaxID=1697558 RepID=UPI003AA914BF
MKNQSETMFESAFAEDTYKGLTQDPKYLLSKYIYDKNGDLLFQRIMNMPEYYLTSCEFDILEKNKKDIAASFKDESGFDLIELGAGDGKKTKVLLKEFVAQKFNFNYLPVDISANVLEGLEESVKKEIPEVNIKVQQGTYFNTLEKLAEYNTRKKVILVLGSNIGNLSHPQAVGFLKNIAQAMSKNDMLFMGFDQKKDPQKILNAYSDKQGITEQFNKNILVRINRELGGNFEPDNFMHWETYNPETGTAKSYLVSKKDQKVEIRNLNLKVSFSTWETIHTEISQKYDDSIVNWLAEEAGLTVEHAFTDQENCYKNYIFKSK